MATKKEIKAWLKEVNLGMAQVDFLWKELGENGNTLVDTLKRSGQTWTDLNMHCIRQIPTQKEKDTQTFKKRAEEAAIKQAEEEQKAKDDAYYNEHFLELMVEKIDNKIELTEDEVRNLVMEEAYEVTAGENRRWSRTISSLFEHGDRLFMVDWEQGLTESQENMFYDQPYEVEKTVTTRTIEVEDVVYVKKDK